MEKINLYQEMNDKIADLLLGCEDNGMCVYAGTYIKSLEEQLKSYKDLEEQGKLLKLPCAVGDTVYTLSTLPSGKTVIAETSADAFFCALCMYEGRFGKTIFLTVEEAEATLKIWRSREE